MLLAVFKHALQLKLKLPSLTTAAITFHTHSTHTHSDLPPLTHLLVFITNNVCAIKFYA